MSKIIFKIVNSATWEDIQQQGSFAGSADDRRDGYVHLSSADQLRGTLNKHFRGLADLVLLAVDADALAPHLRWEPSRGGQLFPHSLWGIAGLCHCLDSAAEPGRGRSAYPAG